MKENSDLDFFKNNWIKITCGACLTKIAYEIALRSTNDRKIQAKIIRETFNILSEMSKNSFTTELSNQIIEKIEKITGIEDPYKQEKEISNKILLDLEPQMLSLINKYNDGLERFYKILLLTIFGNVVDFATGDHEFELTKEGLTEIMNSVLNLKPVIDDSNKLFEFISEGNKKIMYIVDNAGEIVCDKILINELVRYRNKVSVIVRNKPLVNDAMRHDAVFVSLTEIKDVKIVEADRFCLGFLYNRITKEFEKELKTTDIIISKGQNNFETLIRYKDRFKGKKIFFLLKLKCRPLAEFIGVNKNDQIIKLFSP
ncbi:MAG: damage-control phosphatase ARMT1 family protein [Candidatus Helarchaeota archaeon]